MFELIKDYDLIKQIWKPYTKELGIPYRDYIERHIKDESFFCYKIDGHIAGIGTYTVYNRKQEVAVESLITLPEYRGQGVATKLIYKMYKETESLIKTLGYKFVTEAQEGLPNNLVYAHLSTAEHHYTSRSGKMKLVSYDLDTNYLENKFKDLDI